MQIGILGTGNVAQTLARRLAAAGNRITFRIQGSGIQGVAGRRHRCQGDRHLAAQ
jgi:predicted dinucleotide-binding enzyme